MPSHVDAIDWPALSAASNQLTNPDIEIYEDEAEMLTPEQCQEVNDLIWNACDASARLQSFFQDARTAFHQKKK